MVIENLCPVCGYEMEEPPRDYNICPSCGTEFGIHDLNASVGELRAAWTRSGPSWWSKTDPQPDNWNPFAQLATVGPGSAAYAMGKPETVFIIRADSTTTTSAPILIRNLSDWAGSVWAQREDTQPEAVSS